MVVVLIFSVHSMRPRVRNPDLENWRKYGPIACIIVAIPLIMADITRHLSQDGSWLVGDVLGLPLLLGCVPAYLSMRMVRTARPWGPFSPPKGVELGPGSALFRKRLAVFLALAGSSVAILCASHIGHGTWFGTIKLQWEECGNNAAYPRVNQTWDADACFWSSSQFKCDLNCCVPEDKLYPGGAAKAPSGGYPSVPSKDFPKADDGECECHCCPLSDENLHHLAPMGVLFTIVFTYLGFALLAVGTLWNANITEKFAEIRLQWRQLRGKDPAPAAKKQAAPFSLGDQPVSPSVRRWMNSSMQSRDTASPNASFLGSAGEDAESEPPPTSPRVYSSADWCAPTRR